MAVAPSNVHKPAETGVLFLRLGESGSRGNSEIPLRFAWMQGSYRVLAPRESPPAWAVRLRRDPAVHWRIEQQDFEGLAEPILDPEQVSAAREVLETSAGPGVTKRWFGREAQGFILRPSAGGPLGYRARVEAYFDALAETYDDLVQSNVLDAHLRQVSLSILQRHFSPGQRVLEVGCGTGLETLPLARHGVQVVATDISTGMLNRLSQKASAAGTSSQIVTRRVGTAELEELVDEFGPASFDGAFSDFGALNCEPDLPGVVSPLATLIRPGGSLVLGLWNRLCIPEIVGSLVARRPRRSLARFQSPVPVGLSRYGVPAFATDVHRTVRVFRGTFDLERVTGLSALLPPYDLGALLLGWGQLARVLMQADHVLASRFPLNRLGDHVLLEMRRRV